jgi:hypothetical protein
MASPRSPVGLVVVAIITVGGIVFWASFPPSPPPLPASGHRVAVRKAITPLASSSVCEGAFSAHPLAHTTTVAGDAVHLFDSNGSGVAVGDLDDDGRLDIVLANLDGPASVLWNEGSLSFSRTELAETGTRAVNAVDVDGDGRLDLVFTHRGAGVTSWRTREQGSRHLQRAELPGVLRPAHAMAWADLSGDGHLDLVTGSYDAELDRHNKSSFLFGGGGGVVAYEQEAGRFVPDRLTESAQALSIVLPDLDHDGLRDLVVGNDFNVPDRAWLNQAGGWKAVEPFSVTSEHTMSFDLGDVNNDGLAEIFSTDMKPYSSDTATLARWLPMMQGMAGPIDPADPQVAANVLQVQQADGSFRDAAARYGIEASGWAWSGKFGDLDNDGLLDLYVVNGMIAVETFPYLEDGELVEDNQAYRNQGAGSMEPAPQWRLGSSASGRGMAIADLNDDGRLDIVVNNLGAPAQLFDNRLCGGGAIELDLRWESGGNTHAVGAVATVTTDRGIMTRDVRSGSGYLSGDPPRLHFGIPAGATLERLEITWPDGAWSLVEDPTLQSLVTVTRS